jgi:DUF971 family protein
MAPEQIELDRKGGVLRLAWPGGTLQALPFLALRQACRCAACQSARLLGKPAPAADGVQVVGLRAVGLYAVQLVFSDGHDRGIYPWSLLREQG